MEKSATIRIKKGGMVGDGISEEYARGPGKLRGTGISSLPNNEGFTAGQ